MLSIVAGIVAAVLADKYLKTYAHDKKDFTQKTVVYESGERSFKIFRTLAYTDPKHDGRLALL